MLEAIQTRELEIENQKQEDKKGHGPVRTKLRKTETPGYSPVPFGVAGTSKKQPTEKRKSMEQDKSPKTEDKDAEVKVGDLTPEKDATGGDGRKKQSPGAGGIIGGPTLSPD